MDRVTLFDELRLIERSENEVNGAWKGAHLLLFFLAFVFGSFCTFCFHMLMYLFDEKCVLFPKLLSLTSLRHNVIYEFIPEEKDRADMLPVDFLSTQWVEQSACYLPTYVPLVSGIFGLVWTTMFLMCSTGSRTLTGLQRPWRVIPPVFVFSVALSGLCIYSSTVTHYGLQELCVKLGEITGSSTCSYTVNVATLAYERQIRGVYQATRLTIISAWLHTTCWLLSALLALVRILLAVDFQLVRVSVDLRGNLDKMMESHETQIRTVSPGHGVSIYSTSELSLSESNTEVHFQNVSYDQADSIDYDIANLSVGQSEILFLADEHPTHTSELSLVPEERNKLDRHEAYHSVPKDKQFIVKIVYDLVDTIEFPESPAVSPPLSLTSSSLIEISSDPMAIARQYGQETISLKAPNVNAQQFESVSTQEAQEVAKEIKRNLQERLYRQLIELPINVGVSSSPSTSKKRGHIAFDSSMNITSDMKHTLEDKLDEGITNTDKNSDDPIKIKKKSNLKNIGIQTDKNNKDDSRKKQKVKISESKSTFFEQTSTESIEEDREDVEDNGDNEEDNGDSEEDNGNNKEDKDTQTPPKEKQD